MERLKILLWIGIGIIIGFALNECTHTPCPEVKSDTVTVTKRDTIWGDTLKVVTKTIKPKPIKRYPNLLKPGRTWTVYKDSLVNNEVAIVVTDTVDGTIESKQISYRLKVPLRIIDSVKVTITNIIKVPTPQRGFFIGAEAGMCPTIWMIRFAPEIEYIDKKGYAYSYNYDVLNNFHSVGIKKRLKL